MIKTNLKKIKKNKAFVLLFAVTLAAIFLSIALGLASIALKEVIFSTSAKNTNDAFFSADTGVECALYYDNKVGVFNVGTLSQIINCNSSNVSVSESSATTPYWTFLISGLDSGGQGCTKVSVDKTVAGTTTVTASGYNEGGGVSGSCNPGSSNVERVLSSTYSTGSSSSLAYGGTPWPIPGTIQAENYDTGGEGVSYHDDDPTNDGGAYRSDGVDIEATTDTGGGYDVGWTNTGEWLEYSVNVATTQTYTLNVRVAATAAGGTFHIESNGTNISGTMTVPNTGGYQTWTTISTPVSLTAGLQTLKLVEDNAAGYYNFNWISFN